MKMHQCQVGIVEGAPPRRTGSLRYKNTQPGSIRPRLRYQLSGYRCQQPLTGEAAALGEASVSEQASVEMSASVWPLP